jgi:hypothetical protein
MTQWIVLAYTVFPATAYNNNRINLKVCQAINQFASMIAQWLLKLRQDIKADINADVDMHF